MPAKTIHPIGDQSGGVNTFSNERDVDDKQYTVGYNVDSSVPGEIRCQGNWVEFAERTFSITSTGIAFTVTGEDNLITIVGNGVDFSNFRAGNSIAVSGANQANNNDVFDIKSVAGNSLSMIVEENVVNEGASASITITTTGAWEEDTKPGYGLFPFQTDFDPSGTLVNGYYMAIAKPHATDFKISMYTKPNYNSKNFTENVISIGTAHAEASAGFIWGDNALRIFDTSLTANDHSFSPKKWWMLESGITYFKGASFATEAITSNSWITSTQAVDSPVEQGKVVLSKKVDPFDFGSTSEWASETAMSSDLGLGSLSSAGTSNVALIIQANTADQGSPEPTVGWGKSASEAGFYDWWYSYVYRNDQESLPIKFVRNISLIASALAGGVPNSSNDVTFIPVVRPKKSGTTVTTQASCVLGDGDTEVTHSANASIAVGQQVTGTHIPVGTRVASLTDSTHFELDTAATDDGTVTLTFLSWEDSAWDKNVIKIRLYFTYQDGDPDVKYFIGDYPVISDTAGSDNEIASHVNPQTSDSNLTECAVLLGDKSGSPSSSNYLASIGTYHEVPPSVFTHATMSGIRPATVSVSPRYKTAAIVNRRLYVGNVKQKTFDSHEIEKKFPDRIIKSLPNKFDVLPDGEYIDVAVSDGEEVIKLESLGSRLLQFKQNTLYTIAVAGGEEYLDGTYENMGVLHPSAVTKTEFGIFWVNERGAYIYTGEGRPVNLIDGKIDLQEWSDWITKDAVTGYYPKEKKLLVINNSSNVWSTTGETSVVDMYIFNMLTQSWNQGVNLIGQGTYDAISNVVNYVDENQEIHTLFFVGTDLIYEFKGTEDISGKATRAFNLTTKDIHAGAPHVRKKFYKAYVTYKGFHSTLGAVPTVDAVITGADGKSTVTLVGGTTFADASPDDWRTAEYVIDKDVSDDKTASRNAYSVKLVISGDTVYQNFKINDISLVFRPKSVK